MKRSLEMVPLSLVAAFMASLIAVALPVETVSAADTNLSLISTQTQCMSDLIGSQIACSGTEVSITAQANQIFDGCAFAGDTATVIPAISITSGANARYDIGAFLALDGGNALSGTCQVSVFPESPSPFFDLDFSSQPEDQCGDIAESATIPNVALPLMTIPCLDSNANGTVDLQACVAWATTSTHLCQAPADSLPSHASRCNCSLVDLAGLHAPMRTIEVHKVLDPQSDPGLFDLTLDSVTMASAVGDGGTTGPVEVLSVNQAVVVGELAASGTLSDYTSSIVCLDQVGRCSLDAGKPCVMDSTCANQSAGVCNLTPAQVASCTNCTSLLVPIPVTMATIACTISNTANPNGPDCDDQNACTVDEITVVEGIPFCSHTNKPAFTSCGDPDSSACNAPDSCNASGQCIDHLDSAGTLCRGASGDCDTPEICDGVSKNCPAESPVPSGDQCLLFSNGFEISTAGLLFDLFRAK